MEIISAQYIHTIHTYIHACMSCIQMCMHTLPTWNMYTVYSYLLKCIYIVLIYII